MFSEHRKPPGCAKNAQPWQHLCREKPFGKLITVTMYVFFYCDFVVEILSLFHQDLAQIESFTASPANKQVQVPPLEKLLGNWCVYHTQVIFSFL